MRICQFISFAIVYEKLNVSPQKLTYSFLLHSRRQIFFSDKTNRLSFNLVVIQFSIYIFTYFNKRGLAEILYSTYNRAQDERLLKTSSKVN